ncbi:transcription initiation protein SPT3 homolog isoform X2 [Apostichopus japonicus]|uniref:transcription initiation protein SPT3 homolog isoform X2 n=1 Tax=Stichopus japonicus TaxID=307972 RepID=UPI003AB666C5
MTKQKVKLKKSDKSTGAGGPDSRGRDAVYRRYEESPAGNSKNLHSKVSFVPEVQSMMYALGDCRKPILESAMIVERVVRQQVTWLLRKAADVCVMRGARFIGIEDFIFLMKDNHDKLHQLFQFLLFKDAKIIKLVSDDGDAVPCPGVDQKGNKRRKICLEFLSVIDQTGELTAILEDEDADSYRVQRQERQEQHTRNMDLITYQEYSEARRVHFMKKMVKFKEWVDAHNVEPKPSSFALEILTHIAYETVAQIVDLALIVRRDMLSSPTDPISQTMAPVCLNDLLSIGVHPLHPKLSSSPTSTPLQSPTPASPKSPAEKMLSPFLSSGINAAGNSNSDNSNQGDVKPGTPSGVGTSKSKSKKKKKLSSSSLHNLIQHRSIQPFHIKEAIRRTQERSGVSAKFSSSRTDMPRFLAC